MRIISEHVISERTFAESGSPKKLIERWIHKEIIITFSKQLGEMDGLFSQEEMEDMFGTRYRMEAIVLSIEDFKKIIEILRDHANLNDYWKEQIKYLFNGKP